MRLFYLLICCVVLASCNKVVCREPDCTKATVRWTGDPAVDGLGWMLHFEDGKQEKPLNLDSKFQKDNLAVYVCYEKTDEKHGCFCANGYIYLIKIISIVER